MDDFKINAAKMIAAQQRKKRAQSPETESNWDSSDQDDDDVPQISSEEDSFSPKKHTQRQNNNKKYDNSQSSTPSKKNAAHVLKQDRLSNRNSPALSTKSNRNQKAVTDFVDNGFDSDENESVSSTIKKRPKEKVPPYDFSGEIKGSGDPARQPHPTGKQWKGQIYDAITKEEMDSDQEKQMLAEIRSEMKKVQKTHLDVPKGDVRQRYSDSQPTSSKSTPKISKANRGKQTNKELQSSIEMLTDRQLLGQGVTTSQVDIRQKQMSLGDTAGEEKLEFQSLATLDKEYPDPATRENYIGTRYVYCYEHGSLEYYDTRRGREDIYMANIADKSEKVVRRGVQEVFALFRILADFILILLLETIRFIAFNILQTLIVGAFTVLGDYLLKPVLAALFNNIIQPVSTFVYNVAVATRTVMVPIGNTLKVIITPFVILVKAFRLFEINWSSNNPPTHLQPIQEV